ncbi:HAD-IA family hydrolase [Hymenobacter aerilatus]|uniref:HAD-IA family hydrolase n=1 Tax=Hymenobacter aerilatus TaxID=2932251 RepID=A0A8T9SRH9_9BACT|nr:HAD-IA family hydrolase [Hymenobacter aerilatus]UOR04425.1 HAD-IA family hydrolase [Hymenobacter aerilatus]
MATASDYALIFDMDGVLVNNTDIQAHAFQMLFRDLGLTTNAHQLLLRLNGMPAGAILQSVFRHAVPEEDIERYTNQREFLYRTLYWDDRQEVPGLTPFLQAARAMGFRIALGTGSGNDTIGYIIDHLDLRRYFDEVITKDDVDRGKPHGDTYSVAAEKVGIPPERCLVFEDAIMGEQAAYKAGMRCLCLSTSIPADKFQAPIRVIQDFTEITPADVLKLLDQNTPVPTPSKELASRQYAQDA